MSNEVMTPIGTTSVMNAPPVPDQPPYARLAPARTVQAMPMHAGSVRARSVHARSVHAKSLHTNVVHDKPVLRVTRRGRIVIGVAVASLLMLAVVWYAGMLAPQGAAASVGGPSQPFTYVTVEAGSTLWKVANDVAPTADPRDVIDEIVRLNRLESTDVYPGEELAIPAQYAR